MSDSQAVTDLKNSIKRQVLWGVDAETWLCPQCDWQFLGDETLKPTLCPHCFQAELHSQNTPPEHLPHAKPPELFIPFRVTDTRLKTEIETFAKGIPFSVRDLNAANLNHRMQKIYLPIWLVDSTVKATWQAEAGFNYEAVTHRERFEQGAGWQSEKITETRIRWEPRVGRLQRTYHNVTAPALDDYDTLDLHLAEVNLAHSRPYETTAMQASLVRLPTRAPGDAWPIAETKLPRLAQEECQTAATADHIREFRWSPTYHDQNWTQLLVPFFSTYYLDDDKLPRSVLINGHTGAVLGVRRASMKRAKRLAFILFGIALFFFLLSLGWALISLWLSGAVAGASVLIGMGAFLIALSALLPLLLVWSFNRQQVMKPDYNPFSSTSQ